MGDSDFRSEAQEFQDIGFSNYQRAGKLLQELERGLDRLWHADDPGQVAEQLLEPYHRLLRIRDRTFPLLMQEAPLFQLDHQFAYLYLLPPLLSAPDRRWLLCQYPKTFDSPPKLQILVWTAGDDDVSLTPLPKSSDQKLKSKLDPGGDVSKPPALDRRARRLRVADLADTVAIRLDFDDGRVLLMADAEKGITTLNWIAVERRKLPREECCSSDTMQPVLTVERGKGEAWKDDLLKTIWGEPIETGGIGRIRGVDGPQTKPGFLYAGGTKAQLFRIDMERHCITAESSLMRGAILDVLVVPHPQPDREYAILVSVSNGLVYLMDDLDGESNIFRILHFQKSKRPIIHMVGNGGRHILGRDSHANLIPLRIFDTTRFLNLRNSLTQNLYATLRVDKRLKSYLAGPPVSRLTENEIGSIAPFARLALEHYLANYLWDPDFQTEDFALFCEYIRNGYYDEALLGDPLRRWALLHLELLERLWGLMRSDCDWEWHGPGTTHQAPGFTGASRFEFLWSLLDLPPRAPDWLLLRMLRDADRVHVWLEYRGLLKPDSREWNKVEILGSKVRKVRSRFLPRSHELHQITVQATWRLHGQAMHLRIIDHERNRIAFVQGGFGLRIVQIDPETGRWSQLLDISWEHQPWKGLVTTLGCGPELELAAGGDVQEPSHLFVATDEGDLCFLQIAWDQKRVVVKPGWLLHDQMEVRCCTPIRVGSNSGILLGGSNENGAPRLAWLPVLPGGPKFLFTLWHGEEDGSLRKLVYDGNGRLWAIDRDQGRLHHWRLSEQALNPQSPRAPLVKEPDWLYAPGHLYSLSRGGVDHAILACGGHGGVVYGLDMNTGELRWTVVCGKNVKRIEYLEGTCLSRNGFDRERGDDSGVWLLGGEIEDIVLVDNDGLVQAVLEDMGPLSSVCAYQDGQHLLICGMDGRVILLDARKPPENAKVLAGEKGLQSWLHPLRLLHKHGGADLVDCLANYYPKDFRVLDVVYPRDALAVTAVLDWVLDDLLHGDRDQSLLEQIKGFAEKEAPQRLGWLLHKLNGVLTDRDLPEERLGQRKRAASAGLALCDLLWNHRMKTARDEEICYLTVQVLQFLETMSLDVEARMDLHPFPGYSDETYQSLLFEINKCLWYEAPNRLKCVESLSNETPKRELRLAQIARNWARVNRLIPKAPIGQRLAALCEVLGRIWNEEFIAPIGWRISGVASKNLPWTSLKERQWQYWMVDAIQALPLDMEKKDYDKGELEDKEKIITPKPVPDNEVQPGPYPLVLLENADLRPLGTEDVEALRQVWGDVEPWKRWVNKHAELLQNLDTDPGAAVPRASHLWRVMVELLNHFAEAGQSQFTRANGYTLLEFWWPRLVTRWRSKIEERRKELIRDFRINPDQYIRVQGIEEIWLNASTVKLRIHLINEGPNDLRIEALRDGEQMTEPLGLAKPLELQSGTEGVILDHTIFTPRDGRVNQILALDCVNQFSGDHLQRRIFIERKRGLERFTSEREWQPTWRHLGRMLAMGGRPVWIDGHVLSDRERDRLKELVADQYGIDVGQELTVATRIDTGCFGQAQLFSPDVALAAPPGRLVEQIHALLHGNGVGRFSFLALAIWRCREESPHFVGRCIPDSVIEALGEHLPGREQVRDLLHALLGGVKYRFNQFTDGLLALPDQALGAWCLGEPLYQDPDMDPGSATPEERYATPASEFGARVWRLIDKLPVSLPDLTNWLTSDADIVAEQREARCALYDLFECPQNAETVSHSPEILHAAKKLLEVLGDSAVSFIKGSGVFADLNLDVLHIQYQRCYVLPVAADPRERTRFHDQPPGVWLCPNLKEPTRDLPGIVIALDEDQCLSLLHARDVIEAQALLNRVAATQHSIVPSRVFRTSGGLGRMVDDNFAGRDEEMATAIDAIIRSDDEIQALLVIGGRRMGKTSFRERLVYELNGRNEDRNKRLFLLLDLQSFPRDPNVSQPYVEYRLFKSLYDTLRKNIFPFPPSLQWSDSQKDSPKQRDEARDRIRRHLEKIKIATGHTPVLVLDETERFAEADCRHEFQTMDFIRELLYASSICLVATSYPHGRGQRYALQHLEKDTGSPFYNTITTTLYMTRWQADTAWNYLRAKLSGFGIELPLYLREDMLRICRGVPWLVHLLGREICSVSGEMGSRRLINLFQWQRVRQEALRQLMGELRETVEARAQEIDTKRHVRYSRNSEARLANGHLWGAFVAIAKNYPLPVAWNTVEDKRDADKPLCAFNVDDLYRAFEEKINREYISDVLNRLTASSVLEGDGLDASRFYFANDLLPMVIQELGGNNHD